MVMICFKNTELFFCQKQHADFIKLSLETPWAAQPAGSPLLPSQCAQSPRCLVLGAAQGSLASWQGEGLRDRKAAPTHTILFCQVFGNVDVSFQHRTKCNIERLEFPTKQAFPLLASSSTHTHTRLQNY